MDRKINMPEILDIIFSHIETDFSIVIDNGRIRPKTTSKAHKLAALARTCKTFHNPALNALWKVQYSLVPALRCFPEDLWERSSSRGEMTFLVSGYAVVKNAVLDSLQAFRRPLSPTDWDRPMTYWPRIRNFRIFLDHEEEPSTDVVETLRLCFPGTYLFPNIQELHLHRDNPTALPFFGILFAPKLTRITLTPGDSMTRLSLLPALGVKYPDLTDVDLMNHRITLSPPILRSISAFLCLLTRLESLAVANIDANTLNHVSQLPNLKSLFLEQLLAFEPSPASYSSRFPALEKLHLGSTTPQIVIQIIRTIQSRRLTSLRVGFRRGLPNTMTTTELYTTIAAHCSHSSLSSLRITDDSAEPDAPDDEDFDNYTVGPSTLRILFPFTDLTSLILTPFHGFDLDDDTVLEMARAWSRLEELKIISSGPPSYLQ